MGRAPLCVNECTSDCIPPCPRACTDAKFNARVQKLTIAASAVLPPVTVSFYVNAYNGSDSGPGTREKPWETFDRAMAQLRYLRVMNTNNPDGTTLPQPVQIWMKDFDPDQKESSYYGRTFYT